MPRRTQTIQIHLPGEYEGVNVAYLANSVAHVYVLPREHVAYARGREDLATPALYLLFDDERSSVYIGECENFNHRVIDHEAKKSFWQWAIVCVASSGGLNKAEVKYLEAHAIAIAIAAGRYEVLNKTSPVLNNLDEFRITTLLDYFDDVTLLIKSLGYDVFESVKVPEVSTALESLPTIKEERLYDTIVCPGDTAGYQEAFVQENAWWAPRIGKDSLDKLKYIAIYETSPISAIRAYAHITKIEPIMDKPGKYKIFHDGNIKKIEHPVELGSNLNLALRSPKYYLLEHIKDSKTLLELTSHSFNA
jgi:hypothetical protein